TIAETEDFGVLRIVVDKPDFALQVLKANGFVSRFTDIVGVEVEDTPGGLANILKVLSQNDINVEYMYGFLEKSGNKALLVFRFDDPDSAIDVLTKNNITVLRKEDVVNL
ncbi:hypothetical protein J7M23_07360, partial [Candidatus Sumerlaeota bacterium]|nr:hypothetical protein [Candidatus Sumerlaeota bacterium]